MGYALLKHPAFLAAAIAELATLLVFSSLRAENSDWPIADFFLKKPAVEAILFSEKFSNEMQIVNDVARLAALVFNISMSVVIGFYIAYLRDRPGSGPVIEPPKNHLLELLLERWNNPAFHATVSGLEHKIKKLLSKWVGQDRSGLYAAFYEHWMDRPLADLDQKVFKSPGDAYGIGVGLIGKRCPYSVIVLRDKKHHIYGYITLLFFKPDTFVNHSVLAVKVQKSGYLPICKKLAKLRDRLCTQEDLNNVVDCYVDAFVTEESSNRNKYFTLLFHGACELIRRDLPKLKIKNIGTIVVDGDGYKRRTESRPIAKLPGAVWAKNFGLHKFSEWESDKHPESVRAYYGATFDVHRVLWKVIWVAYILGRPPLLKKFLAFLNQELDERETLEEEPSII